MIEALAVLSARQPNEGVRSGRRAVLVAKAALATAEPSGAASGLAARLPQAASSSASPVQDSKLDEHSGCSSRAADFDRIARAEEGQQAELAAACGTGPCTLLIILSGFYAGEPRAPASAVDEKAMGESQPAVPKSHVP